MRKKVSLATRKKMSDSQKRAGNRPPLLYGVEHPNWKGRKATYRAKHYWASSHFGVPRKCEKCGTTKAKKFEWANKSGKYKRNREDWMRLCTRCHHRLDEIHRKGWATRKNGVKV